MTHPHHMHATAECGRCGRPTPDGYICTPCAANLAQQLTQAAGLVPDAEVTIAGLDRFGDRGPHIGETPLPVNLAASERLAAIRTTVVGWVRHIANERGHEPPWHWALLRLPAGAQGPLSRVRVPDTSTDALLHWLTSHTEWLRHRPEGIEAFDTLHTAVRHLTRLVDSPTPRQYLGPCGQPTEDGQACPGELSAPSGAAYTCCRDCGTQHDVAARKDWLLEQLDDQLATASDVARALVAYGLHVTPAMVRGWAHRGRLAAHGTDPNGRPTYRVGDVLDLVYEAAERHTDKAA